MNFQLKFWHHHSIPWSRFPYRARYFCDTRTFFGDFCIGYAECPPYFYFRSSWPTDVESVSRDAQGEGVVPLPIYWYHLKGNWMLYNFAADSFYIMKFCSRLFLLHCLSRPKYDTSMYFDPHFEEVKGRRRTLVDGSLESPCRVLVKRNWTSFSISYGWGVLDTILACDGRTDRQTELL